MSGRCQTRWNCLPFKGSLNVTYATEPPPSCPSKLGKHFNTSHPLSTTNNPWCCHHLIELLRTAKCKLISHPFLYFVLFLQDLVILLSQQSNLKREHPKLLETSLCDGTEHFNQQLTIQPGPIEPDEISLSPVLILSGIPSHPGTPATYLNLLASRSDSSSVRMSPSRTGPLTLRMIWRFCSLMNSTFTWVHWPWEPVRPRTFTTRAKTTDLSMIFRGF